MKLSLSCPSPGGHLSLQSPFPRPALGPGLFHKPHPVCDGPGLVQPLELQHGGVVCVGLWGVRAWVATHSIPGSVACSPIPNHIAMGAHSSLYPLSPQHLLRIRCQAGSVIGTGNSMVSKAGFLFSWSLFRGGERDGRYTAGKKAPGLVSDGGAEHSFRVLAFLRPQ